MVFVVKFFILPTPVIVACIRRNIYHGSIRVIIIGTLQPSRSHVATNAPLSVKNREMRVPACIAISSGHQILTDKFIRRVRRIHILRLEHADSRESDLYPLFIANPIINGIPQTVAGLVIRDIDNGFHIGEIPFFVHVFKGNVGGHICECSNLYRQAQFRVLINNLVMLVVPDVPRSVIFEIFNVLCLRLAIDTVTRWPVTRISIRKFNSIIAFNFFAHSSNFIEFIGRGKATHNIRKPIVIIVTIQTFTFYISAIQHSTPRMV